MFNLTQKISTHKEGFLAWFLAGIILGTLIVLAAEKSLFLGLAVPFVFAGAILLVLRPDLGMLLFLFTLLVMDEFPSGLGETAERSTRTAFYGTSLGIPGFYSTDLFVFGLLTIYFIRYLILRCNINIPIDRISVSLFFIGFIIIISVVVSFSTGNPFANYQYALHNTSTSFELNDRAAQLIAMFQYKTFLFLFLSYILGLFFIRSPDNIKQVIRIVFIAALVNIIVGLVRMMNNPSILTKMYPLFYHSPSSWIFSIVIFFTILGISYHLLNRQQSMFMIIVSVILFICILLSYRRTMWAAIFVSGSILLFYLPSFARSKIIIVASVLLSVILLGVMFTPIGSGIIHRITETGIEDASTLYRFAIFYYMVDNFFNIPLFGYGPRPLWDITVQLGYFETNMENVHSLYYWYFLRHGLIGFIIFLTALSSIILTIHYFIKRTLNPLYRVLSICILLALITVLISGLFNPVYGEVRYMVLLGFFLAIMSRIFQFDSQNKRNSPI